MNNRYIVVLMIGGVLLAAEGYAALNAEHLACPTPYRYSGPYSDTSAGRLEISIREFALLIAATGSALVLLACNSWLRGSPAAD
ncbi:hypothetical protein [Capsulimonas corticalis]|uniref:hypothetical protein n=1 Tax=Capsulimonas corticalis TaxID=2219043 RepID=UPI000F649787|nr:hypothetical protein [Capsulimonas corticalis]